MNKQDYFLQQDEFLTDVWNEIASQDAQQDEQHDAHDAHNEQQATRDDWLYWLEMPIQATQETTSTTLCDTILDSVFKNIHKIVSQDEQHDAHDAHNEQQATRDDWLYWLEIPITESELLPC